MSILIFIIILSVLIVVHEMGHFSVAKYFGIRVDEFGLGYPPLAKKLFNWKGTDFTLNWLPFGGFVKIFGENPVEVEASGMVDGQLSQALPNDSFQTKNRGIQAAVLVAGVLANFIFAWFLISIGFMTGIAAPAGMSLPADDYRTVVTTVLPGSPAGEAGLKAGDAIIGISRGSMNADVTPEALSEFIAVSEEPILFDVMRGDNNIQIEITPELGVVEGKPAVGIAMDRVGTVKLSPHKAIWQSLVVTTELTWLTAKALGGFVKQAVVGKADFSQVTGPVGIVSMVGDVSELGFSYLLTFTALLSLNLAVINLVPFPALDGGRLVFVAIEAITRKPVPAKIFNVVNTVGFALLIFLMILITVRDVQKVL